MCELHLNSQCQSPFPALHLPGPPHPPTGQFPHTNERVPSRGLAGDHVLSLTSHTHSHVQTAVTCETVTGGKGLSVCLPACLSLVLCTLAKSRCPELGEVGRDPLILVWGRRMEGKQDSESAPLSHLPSWDMPECTPHCQPAQREKASRGSMCTRHWLLLPPATLQLPGRFCTCYVYQSYNTPGNSHAWSSLSENQGDQGMECLCVGL